MTGGQVALDHILMRKAFADAARWPAGIRLNVNLSPRELQEGSVVSRLSALGIDHRRVNLEITETSVIEDPQATTKVLAALKDIGVDLWLDDFGTGHSSLTHLHYFPVDGIKLAGAFVRPIPGHRRSSVITRAILDLAHELELEVVAEEVERKEQLEFLLEANCEYVQGFLFSRPMTSGEFQATLAAFSSGAK